LRVPLLWVVGAREMAERSVTERAHGDERRSVPLVDAIGRARLACAVPVPRRDGGDVAVDAADD